MTDTSISKVHGKEIADGLIRAKQLEIIKLGENLSLDCSQILYNLAFSPKIRHIDMTGDKSANNADVAEALYKLLKISGSIQNLLLGGTNILQKLTRDFFIALGESKTMETLNLDFDTSFQGKQTITTLTM